VDDGRRRGYGNALSQTSPTPTLKSFYTRLGLLHHVFDFFSLSEVVPA
jgi:hypothetical protein